MGFLKKAFSGVGKFVKKNIRSASKDIGRVAGNIVGGVVGGVATGIMKPKAKVMSRLYEQQNRFQLQQDNNLLRSASTPSSLYRSTSLSSYQTDKGIKEYLPYIMGGVSLLFGGILILKK